MVGHQCAGEYLQGFKTIVPDEIARLLGRVENPKNIILDTLAEQAHTLHSYNAYKDMARFGMNKWLWKNTDEYAKWAAKNGHHESSFGS